MVLSSLSHLQSGGGENKCVTNTLSVYILVSHFSSIYKCSDYTEQKYTLLFVSPDILPLSDKTLFKLWTSQWCTKCVSEVYNVG